MDGKKRTSRFWGKRERLRADAGVDRWDRTEHAAWEADLTDEQKLVLYDVRKYKEELWKSHRKYAAELDAAKLDKNIEAQKNIAKINKGFLESICLAVGAGLEKHPDIAPHVENMRILGDRNVLPETYFLFRPIRGIDPPQYFHSYVPERRKKGLSEKEILDELIDRDFFAKGFSQSSFSKLCSEAEIPRYKGINPELINYVFERRKQGATDGAIRQELINQGMLPKPA
jgi:hypothetical protein